MRLQKRAFPFFLFLILHKTHAMECQDTLIQAIADVVRHDIHYEIQNKFDLLFTVHLELIRDKLRKVLILLPNKTISPVRIVYPLEDIVPMMKELQKNRRAFHTFINQKQCTDALPEIIDPLISTILDLREEIDGYYLRIKEQIFLFYTFPLEQLDIINCAFGLLESLINEFDYPTPHILNESRKRIKTREEEILTHFNTSK